MLNALRKARAYAYSLFIELMYGATKPDPDAAAAARARYRAHLNGSNR